MTIYEYLLVTEEELRTFDVSRNYVTYRIKKRDSKKTRRIDAPTPELKSIQKRILKRVLYNFKPHKIAHGFVKHRSPRSNAAAHMGKKYVIKVDIQDFFPSISKARVIHTLRYLLNKPQYCFDIPQDKDVELLAELLCLNDALPQGSPASPTMTNLICYGMDIELEGILERIPGSTITRYADDVTISFDDKDYIPKALAEIKHILLKHGFRVNNKKVKICRYYQRQQITGVVVNSKLNVPKQSWKNLRAALHQKANVSISEKTQQQLRGQIEWLRSLNPEKGTKYLEKLGVIVVEKPCGNIASSASTP